MSKLTDALDRLTNKRPEARPMIYAYSEANPRYDGLLKVGYTTIDVEKRVAQQFPTLKPGDKPYRIVFRAPAIRNDGTTFMDHDVHSNLEANGFYRLRDSNGKKTEWFNCTIEDIKAAYISIRDRIHNSERRDQDFSMRPEQEEAIRKTMQYYKSMRAEDPSRKPKFLWNAKMRFGKTFTTYQLAKRLGFKRILILTFKVAVQGAWRDDLLRHVDFEGWQFIGRSSNRDAGNIADQFAAADKTKPIVCFGSFQDFLGTDKRTGQFKPHHEWVRTEDWDLVVFDEYHFGAWNYASKNSKSKGFLEYDDDSDEFVAKTEDSFYGDDSSNAIDETWLPIKTRFYLFLSGTPFKALNSGEFIEEQIYNWTYMDEQAAKMAWPSAQPDLPNPYEALPGMIMLTYQMPEEIRKIALGGEFNSFDLNAFFEAKGEGWESVFVMKEYVQKWLDIIRGAYLPTALDDLKSKSDKPAMPFSDKRLLPELTHTLWFLPHVNSCYAMANLLNERHNSFYHDFTVNVCAGPEAGSGEEALPPVLQSMKNPLESKTITLTCGKLTTGVTVKPWTGIFMLTNMKSPETYFQAAFRVQSPWTIEGENGRTEIVKKTCYVFDFALDRALRMVSDYSCQLSVNEEGGPERKVQEFIDFLPVLAYDGSAMRKVSATDILDMALAGTSATLLARRWESAKLVNVDNATLARLLSNEEAMRALMAIEDFRGLNSDIETIINKSDAVKKARKEAAEEDRELSREEKKTLTEEEKEYKSKRKKIQQKLIKFATRIPVFMYLTDYREQTLKDVITQLEPGLFKKVTGLDVRDFNLLVSLGVFNDALMNDAVYKFRRYEDSSLSYAGINKHASERIGLFDTSLSQYDYFYMAQQESMITPQGFSKSK